MALEQIDIALEKLPFAWDFILAGCGVDRRSHRSEHYSKHLVGSPRDVV